jgi:alanyl aminopeptidase
MTSEGWAALLDNIEHLNTREVLSVQDSLEAAFRAGKVDADVYIKGMTAFARHPEYDVAVSAGDLLGWMYEDLPKDIRPDLARLVKDMYEARYEAIVGTDSVEGQLLAPTLARNLIVRGVDTALLKTYSDQGAAYLGLSGTPDKTAVKPNMLGNALRAVMIMHPDEAYGPLMAMVKSGSSFEKGAAIGALAQTPDTDMAQGLRAAALSDTETFTGRQATSLISSLLGNEIHREATWEWFKENFDAYVSNRVPDVRIGRVPGYGGYFCGLDRREEVKSFMESKAALIPGYERSLAQTLERIELCAALTKAKGTDVAKALAAR